MKKFQTEIIIALALVLLSAGIGYNTANEKQYNPYESRVVEINGRMQEVIANPTTDNLGNMQTDIFYTYYPWAERQTAGEQKDTFIAYLEACNKIIISMSKGNSADTSEMNRLYNELK